MPIHTILCPARSPLALALVIALSLPATLLARELHVSALAGDDTNDGASIERAFATLKKAASVVQPGDTVLIGDGIYTDSDPALHFGSVLTISTSGRPDAWITWRARPGHRPEIRPDCWNGIVVNASYQLIEGLAITGQNDSLTLIDARADATRPEGAPRFNMNGLIIDGRQLPPDQKPHHVIVRNCVVSKCSGGGIVALETDYVTIEDCLVFDNAWYARYANSGISSIENWAHDEAPGYHFIIQRNHVWNNRSLVPWMVTGKLSDGNGIILDVSDPKRQGPTNPNADAAVAAAAAPVANAEEIAPKPDRPHWKNRSLVANNVSAFNGGSGIHTFRTSHVDIVNNTTYHNGSVVGYEELFSNQCRDVVMTHNVIVPRPGGRVTSNHGNTDVHWDFNLYPIKQDTLAGPNDVIADPQFVSVRRDLREGDFRLQPGGPGNPSALSPWNRILADLPLGTGFGALAHP